MKITNQQMGVIGLVISVLSLGVYIYFEINNNSKNKDHGNLYSRRK